MNLYLQVLKKDMKKYFMEVQHVQVATFPVYQLAPSKFNLCRTSGQLLISNTVFMLPFPLKNLRRHINKCSQQFHSIHYTFVCLRYLHACGSQHASVLKIQMLNPYKKNSSLARPLFSFLKYLPFFSYLFQIR